MFDNTNIFEPQTAATAPSTAATPRLFSIETYLDMEEKATDKHEFHNGKIIKMAGGTFNHDTLSTRVSTYLTVHIEENELAFFVNGSNLKIRIESVNRFVYPDALVIQDTPQYYRGRKAVITNPFVIVEVLSDSTEDFDTTTKFEWYKTLPSFQEYLIIRQDRPKATVFTRQNDGIWLETEFEGLDSTIILQTLPNCELPLKRLYRSLDL
jgi:Uma2 family endonuclease